MDDTLYLFRVVVTEARTVVIVPGAEFDERHLPLTLSIADAVRRIFR